jgi:hypothetical protein
MMPIVRAEGAPAGVAVAPPASAEAHPVPDETADSLPDTAATLAQQFSKRVSVVLLEQQSQQQLAQLRIDRMKADFNDSQQERAELLREANVLRDMALEQAKKDDEVLKKYIAMI